MGFRKEFRELISFSPADRKDTSPVKDRLEEIEQKLEEIRTEALEPLKLLVSTKAILFTRSTEKGLNAPFRVERIKNQTRDVSLTKYREGSNPARDVS